MLVGVLMNVIGRGELRKILENRELVARVGETLAAGPGGQPQAVIAVDWAFNLEYAFVRLAETGPVSDEVWADLLSSWGYKPDGTPGAAWELDPNDVVHRLQS